MTQLLSQVAHKSAIVPSFDDYGSWRREARSHREAFRQVRKAEDWYSAQLRQIARHIGHLVRHVYNPTDPASVDALTQMLERYAEILQPWSKAVGARMLMDVEQRDERAWRRYSQYLGIEIRELLQHAPVGAEYAELLDAQVKLITSLPIEALPENSAVGWLQYYRAETAKANERLGRKVRAVTPASDAGPAAEGASASGRSDGLAHEASCRLFRLGAGRRLAAVYG